MKDNSFGRAKAWFNAVRRSLVAGWLALDVGHCSLVAKHFLGRERTMIFLAPNADNLS